MAKVSHRALYRVSVVKFSQRFGVAKASRRFEEAPSTIYRWKSRYDGTVASLTDISRRPHSHPNAHTEEEIEMIRNMRRRNPELGIVYMWCRMRRRGYTRSLSGLYRVSKREGLLPVKKTRQKRKRRDGVYEGGRYPGERIQIDVKIVPKRCYRGAPFGERLVQYSAIDEFSRLRFIKAYREQTTYSSAHFARECTKYFPFKIVEIQTDNGTEFTARVLTGDEGHKSLFEETLISLGISHKKIRPYTPEHNGRVERSHREDNMHFYRKLRLKSFADFEKKLTNYLKRSNKREMRPLGYLSPVEFLKQRS